MTALLAKHQKEIDDLKKLIAGLELKPGPIGKTGPAGKDGVGRDGKDGRDGVPGPPGKSVSLKEVREIVRQVLEGKSLKVVFEKGDDPSEPERIVVVNLNGGELRIPAVQLRIRNVDKSGKQIGDAVDDTAPLGSPLKIRFRPPGLKAK